jgi:hypothetical protein
MRIIGLRASTLPDAFLEEASIRVAAGADLQDRAEGIKDYGLTGGHRLFPWG